MINTHQTFSLKEIEAHRKEPQFSPSQSFDYSQITSQIFLGTKQSSIHPNKIQIAALKKFQKFTKARL